MNKLQKNTQIIIYGLGSSGYSCLKFLLKSGFKNIYAFDDNQAIYSATIQKLDNQNVAFDEEIFVNLQTIQSKVTDKAIIVAAPGVPLFYPEGNSLLDAVSHLDVNFMCDLQLFYLMHQHIFNKKNIINVAVTGTNGKSTICAMLNHAFVGTAFNANIVGNFGLPIFDSVDKFIKDSQDGNLVMINEVSSFQLDLINEKIFDFFVISNISQDHLTRYESFQAYIDSKMRIFEVTHDYSGVIINVDDDLIASNIKSNSSNIFSYSVDPESKSDIYCNQGRVHMTCQSKVFSIGYDNLTIPGEHNLQNFLAVSSLILKIHESTNSHIESLQKCIENAMAFKGLEHRMQLLPKKSGVLFINDSKATNPESSLNALKSYKNIFWIVGGDSKGCDYNILDQVMSNVAYAYIIGEDYADLENFLKKNDVNYDICFNLGNAVEKSFSDASVDLKGEPVVMLSPASSSLDQWQNYIKRGEYFCKKVNEI